MVTLVRWCRRVLFALLTSTALCAAAQADPPGRVGRIVAMQGQVWRYDAEQGNWVEAVRNRPLTSADRIATDADGRAELSIGSSTVRLGAGSDLEVLQLDDERVRMQLHAGRLALDLRTPEAAREFELVTDEGRFEPESAGHYRLDRIDATTSITVWSGQLVFQAPDFAATVIAGQRADISLADGRTRYSLAQPERDAFADEVAAADAAFERSVDTLRYVSPEMTGAESLGAYGYWENDAEYGALWIPRAVVPGWAPYRYGHWAFVRPWGWTWVDDAPWGFAPFHYGRWVYRRNLWCWVPGRWVARPVYAPALVAWVGAPLAGASVAVSVGRDVGWFPLAPREVFVPPYRVSPNYVRNVNVTQVTNITNVTQIINSPNTVVEQTRYVNRGLPAAVTVVPVQVVSGRKPVAPARVQLTDPHPNRAGERKVTLSTQAPVSAAAPVPAPAAMPVPAARAPVPMAPHQGSPQPVQLAPRPAGRAPVAAPPMAPAAAAAPPRPAPPPPAAPPPAAKPPPPLPSPTPKPQAPTPGRAAKPQPAAPAPSPAATPPQPAPKPGQPAPPAKATPPADKPAATEHRPPGKGGPPQQDDPKYERR